MARTRKAILTAAFSYAQFALSMASAFVLLPLILHFLGARNYGLWLATGELLAYLGMTDLGVFAVLPWMIAVAHGRSDQKAIRQMLANGVVVGLTVSGLIIGGSLVVWIFSSNWLGLSEQDKAALAGPLAVSAVGLALSFPFLIFESIVVALQDALVYGVLKIGQLVLTIILTWVLLEWGWEFYALSIAAVVSNVVKLLGCLIRSLWLAPEFLRHWPIPTWHGVFFLLREGTGSWLGSWGTRLLTASNGLILAIIGHLEWAPVYVAMTKIPQFLQQLCRVIPDSGLLGLAELYGQRQAQRVREIIHCMLFFHMFLSGAAACLILAINPSFIHWWLGDAMFGGLLLNALLAANFLIRAVSHSIISPIGAVGRRLEIGAASILDGIIYVVLSLWLGTSWGLIALPIAFTLSCMATRMAWAVYLQYGVFQITPRMTFLIWLLPVFLRSMPAMTAAGLIGYFLPSAPLWQVLALLAPVGAFYLLSMRPVLNTLPLPDTLRRRLTALRLLPPSHSTCPGILRAKIDEIAVESQQG